MLKKWLGTLHQAGKNNYRSKDLLEYDKWLKQGKFLLLHIHYPSAMKFVV